MKHLLKKNLWTLFYILLGMGLALLVLISYMQYKNVERDLRSELAYLSKSTSEATNHYFIQQEILLNILDRHLFEDEEIKDKDHVRRLFKNLLQMNPALAGISISDPEGNIVLLSKTCSPEELQNLKHSKECGHAFEKARVERGMVRRRAF